jgi:hypothetical protein
MQRRVVRPPAEPGGGRLPYSVRNVDAIQIGRAYLSGGEPHDFDGVVNLSFLLTIPEVRVSDPFTSFAGSDSPIVVITIVMFRV